VAAKYLACGVAILGFDFDLHAEVCDHQPQLFGPKVAAFQFLQGMLLALCCTCSALVLDFFDTPVLATVELAFGHERSVEGPERGVENDWQSSMPGLNAVRFTLVHEGALR